MVTPGDRTKKSESKRTPSKTTKEYFKGKPSKKRCAITGNVLSGVPHAEKSVYNKHSKTEKRPSVPFGGVLGGKAREQVFIETGKVVAGIKNIDAVDQKYRKYVKQALKRAE